MKKIPLTPYVREVWIARDKREFEATYRRLTGGQVYKIQSNSAGQCHFLAPKKGPGVYLVWADAPWALAHELSHVCLDLFDYIGSHPGGCNGEPFCYLLGHLFEAAKK